MTVEVANESGIGVDELALVSVARYTLDRMGINPLAELSILLMDVAAMTELHIKWMNEAGPTDVMSFPMDELDTARRPDEAGPGPALLGDVVLCPAVATDQAVGAGHSLDDELHLLTVHGVLHLLGYDHAEPGPEREMFRLQNELVDAWRELRDTDAHRARLQQVDEAVLGTVGLAAAAVGDGDHDGNTRHDGKSGHDGDSGHDGMSGHDGKSGHDGDSGHDGKSGQADEDGARDGGDGARTGQSGSASDAASPPQRRRE